MSPIVVDIIMLIQLQHCTAPHRTGHVNVQNEGVESRVPWCLVYKKHEDPILFNFNESDNAMHELKPLRSSNAHCQ